VSLWVSIKYFWLDLDCQAHSLYPGWNQTLDLNLRHFHFPFALHACVSSGCCCSGPLPVVNKTNSVLATPHLERGQVVPPLMNTTLFFMSCQTLFSIHFFSFGGRFSPTREAHSKFPFAIFIYRPRVLVLVGIGFCVCAPCGCAVIVIIYIIFDKCFWEICILLVVYRQLAVLFAEFPFA